MMTKQELEAAVSEGRSLAGFDLAGANLTGANLEGAASWKK